MNVFYQDVVYWENKVNGILDNYPNHYELANQSFLGFGADRLKRTTPLFKW